VGRGEPFHSTEEPGAVKLGRKLAPETVTERLPLPASALDGEIPLSTGIGFPCAKTTGEAKDRNARGRTSRRIPFITFLPD
jgi:hypothetical protein